MSNFQLLAFLAVGFGTYILTDKTNVLNLTENTSSSGGFLEKAVVVLIVGGVFVAIVALIGLCGAWKSNRSLLCVVRDWIKITGNSKIVLFCGFVCLVASKWIHLSFLGRTLRSNIGILLFHGFCPMPDW